MSQDTDYFDVPGGRRHLDEVEYMHGVSGPLVAELELDATDLTGGSATEAVDFAEALPVGALLISAWVEGEAFTSGSVDTTGATVVLGPSGGDPDAWMQEVDAFDAAIRKQGAAGVAWDLPPLLAVATTPAATITATGPAPDLAHLSGVAKIKLLYRRTVGEALK